MNQAHNHVHHGSGGTGGQASGSSGQTPVGGGDGKNINNTIGADGNAGGPTGAQGTCACPNCRGSAIRVGSISAFNYGHITVYSDGQTAPNNAPPNNAPAPPNNGVNDSAACTNYRMPHVSAFNYGTIQVYPDGQPEV